MSARLQRMADGTCRVFGVLDFHGAGALYARTDELFGAADDAAADAPIVLDLSGVEAVGSPGVALLLAWQAEAVRRGRGLTFVDLPERGWSLARLSHVDELIRSGVSV